MPTREEMRGLAEEIIGSYADRVAGIAQLGETVKLDLKGFHDSRTAMSKELRTDLAKVRLALAEDDRQRQSEAREFMGELGRAVAEGKATVKSLLKELDNAHQAMSTQIRADLAKVLPALAEDDRQRQSEAREFIGELGRAVAQGKAAVKILLGEFDSAHNAMSREMKATLARGRQILAKEEKERQGQARQFMGELGRKVTEGKTATQAQLRKLAEEQAGARDEWQILTSTLQAQRVGAAVAAKPPEAVAVPAEEITPETDDIQNRAFEYLANHPDGTKLVELEKEFGVSRIEMARLLKDLMGENKVEKRELLYFAI